MVEVSGNENLISVFRTYLRQKWINYIKARTKWSNWPIPHISSNVFQQQKCVLSVIIRQWRSPQSQRPP